MKGHLLDANILIALAWPNHTHHARAHAWFQAQQSGGWGTCMVTELAFVRVSSNPMVQHHVSPQAAHAQLLRIRALAGHFFADEPRQGFAEAEFAKTLPNTLTHHLVTDAYLATLASLHGLRLVTFDRELARVFRGIVLI